VDRTLLPTSDEISTLSPSAQESSTLVVPTTCRAVDGVFGTFTNEVIYVRFRYEVEMIQSSEADLENDVLPELENAFVNFLLPSMFPEVCSERRMLQQRRLATTGISARPDDTILDGVLCESLSASGNSCGAVQGELTLFSDRGRSLTDEATVRDVLKKGMDDNEFVDSAIHPDIVRVSYVLSGDDNGTGSDSDDPGVKGISTDDDDGADLLLIGLISAAAAVVIVAGAVLLKVSRNGSPSPQIDQDVASSAAGSSPAF
jgi:hypothetical protein